MTGCQTCGGFGDRHHIGAHYDGGEDVRVTYAEGGYVGAGEPLLIEHPAPFLLPRCWTFADDEDPDCPIGAVRCVLPDHHGGDHIFEARP